MTSVLLSVALIFGGAALVHASRVCFKGDFDEQVAQLIHKVQMPKEELDRLSLAINDLQQTLQSVWPGCKISPYGSTVAGLSMTISDFDCYVTLPNSTIIDSEASLLKILYKAERAFKTHPEIFENTYVKTTGAVPLVNLIHLPTGRDCDVTFSCPIAISDSELIKYYLSLDNRAYKLAMIVKYWSKLHRFKDIIYISSFTMTLLVIFYLQQLYILPPVALLQKNAERVIVDNWNTGYNEITYNTTNNDSIYQLLGGFLKYYSKFDFDKKIISVYTGQEIKKSAFQDLNTVPDVYEEYKYKVKNNIIPPVNLNVTIITLNPFDHQKNTARAVLYSGSVRFRSEFIYAANIYKKCSSDRFLSSILTRHEDVIPKKGKKSWLSVIKMGQANIYKCIDIL